MAPRGREHVQAERARAVDRDLAEDDHEPDDAERDRHDEQWGQGEVLPAGARDEQPPDGEDCGCRPQQQQDRAGDHGAVDDPVDVHAVEPGRQRQHDEPGDERQGGEDDRWPIKHAGPGTADAHRDPQRGGEEQGEW